MFRIPGARRLRRAVFHLLREPELKRIKHEARQQGTRQARINDFLGRLDEATFITWAGRGIDISEITSYLRENAQSIVDSNLQRWYIDWLSPWWNVDISLYEGAFIQGARDGSPRVIPLDKVLAYWLHSIILNRIDIDRSSMRFYSGNRKIATVYEGAINPDPQTLENARALARPYVGDVVDVVGREASSVTFEKDAYDAWRYVTIATHRRP